jgi:hypothetical protein
VHVFVHDTARACIRTCVRVCARVVVRVYMCASVWLVQRVCVHLFVCVHVRVHVHLFGACVRASVRVRACGVCRRVRECVHVHACGIRMTMRTRVHLYVRVTPCVWHVRVSLTGPRHSVLLSLGLRVCGFVRVAIAFSCACGILSGASGCACECVRVASVWPACACA